MVKQMQMAFRIEPNLRADFSRVEHRRRKTAVDFARASVGLESFKSSEAAEANARRFIEGDIQLAEFVQVKLDAEQSCER